MEEFPDHWKEFIIVPIYKGGNKTDCSNYHGISLLSTIYKILSNNLFPKLSQYVDKIIGDHREFWCSRSTSDKILCIHQILEKKWKYKETVHQQFMDYTKAYDSVRREVFYNILLRVFGTCETS
jgi:hypothetical protein